MDEREIKAPVGRVKRQPGICYLMSKKRTGLAPHDITTKPHIAQSAEKHESPTVISPQFKFPALSQPKKDTPMLRLRKSISEFRPTTNAKQAEKEGSPPPVVDRQFIFPAIPPSKKATSIDRLRKSLSEFNIASKAKQAQKRESPPPAVQRPSIPPPIPPSKKKETSILRLRKSISDLNIADKVKQAMSKKRPRDEEEEAVARKKFRQDSVQEPPSQTRPRSRRVSSLYITEKVKQAMGRKRAREEDEEVVERKKPREGHVGAIASADEPPPLPLRRSSSVNPAFWRKYKELHVYHNELEAMVAATVIAHAYDEQHGLEMLRDPPFVNAEALALLEGERERPGSRSSTATSMSWIERLETIRGFLGLPPPGPLVPAPLFGTTDLTWAGEEVEDFRCFVRAARERDWEERMTGIWEGMEEEVEGYEDDDLMAAECWPDSPRTGHDC